MTEILAIKNILRRAKLSLKLKQSVIKIPEIPGTNKKRMGRLEI